MHGGYANFYSRPCGRGDGHAKSTTFTFKDISTHAPAGGATWPSSGSSCLPVPFLLTPLREGRRADAPIGTQQHIISTHAPAGGATTSIRAAQEGGKFLLTPLREGRPRHGLLCSLVYDISTHAPAGGATICGRSPWRRSPFLLTPLREGRHGARPSDAVGMIISTHAPAGGATHPCRGRPYPK